MKKLVAFTAALIILLPIAPAAASQAWGSNNELVFTSNRAEVGLHRMDSDGRRQRKISNVDYFEEQGAWSPDSERILFVSNEDGDSEIWIMKADGTGRKNLTKNDAQDSGPAWDPNGRSFIFTSTREGASDLYRYRLESGNAKRLTIFGGVSGLAASPSPDGKLIAFSKELSAGMNEIYTMKADGSDVDNVTNSPSEHELAPSWSPNGKLIAVVLDGSIATLNLRTGNAREVAPNGFAPSWSPNGEFLAYQSFDGGDSEIYRVRKDGSQVRNLTDNSLPDYFID